MSKMNNADAIVIDRELVSMITDAGKRHETLRKGIVRATITVTGGDNDGRPCIDEGVNFELAHYGVYADGQHFSRYANVNSPQDMAAALRGGFLGPKEYKWRPKSTARKVAELVADLMPYAASVAFGLALGHLLFA